MNNATIIWKKPGKTIDDRYLSLVLKACPSAVGTVVRMDGDLEVSNNIGVPDLETMKKALEVAKDNEVCLWFANLSDHKDVKQEYIQPFVWEEDGKKVMAILTEGDFSKYSDPGKVDEWLKCYNDFILPSLKDQATLAGGDWDKFLERLRGGLFEQTMLGSTSHRGALLFVPFEGDVIGLAKNELGAEYDWGSVSQTFGFDPNKKEKSVEKVVEKAKGLFNFGGKKASAEPPPTPAKEDKPDGKDEPKEPQKTAVEGEWVDIPVKLKGKARKSHIRKVMGLKSGDELPDGWFKDDFRVFVPKTKTVKSLAEIGKVVAPAKTETAIKGDVGEYPAKEVVPPVISDKNKLAVMDFVVKRVGANSQTLATDPKKMAELEDKVPSFSEATGINLEDTFKLFYSDLKVLQETYPTEFILLMMEFRREYMNSLAEEEPAKVVEPEKLPEPEPVKKAAGMFNFGKK